MGCPGVAKAPSSVLVTVEDANLAVDGPRGAAVAVSVEGDGLHEILVAVLEVQLEGGFFLRGRLDGGGHGWCWRLREEAGAGAVTELEMELELELKWWGRCGHWHWHLHQGIATRILPRSIISAQFVLHD